MLKARYIFYKVNSRRTWNRMEILTTWVSYEFSLWLIGCCDDDDDNDGEVPKYIITVTLTTIMTTVTITRMTSARMTSARMTTDIWWWLWCWQLRLCTKGLARITDERVPNYWTVKWNFSRKQDRPSIRGKNCEINLLNTVFLSILTNNCVSCSKMRTHDVALKSPMVDYSH